MSSTATARSPSPGPAAARPCCGLRRSADSSPITASTPDPPPQRSASVGRTGRASPRASLAEKENDGHHHHQHSRDAARTPGRAARHSIGGGGKSFMAPTISAASKAVAASPAASPRKRILGERNNDPVPSSPGAPPAARAGPPPVQPTEEPLGAPRAPEEPLMSPCPGDLLAHPKPRGPPPSEEPLGAPRRLRLSLDGAPPPPAAAVAVADAPVPSHGARCSLGGEVVKAPVCEVRRRHDGAGDAPYDPKTNYLSPRPQYLRYKPNPRVELYRQNSSARRLDDGLASSDSSDATTTTTEEEEEEEGTSGEEQESQSALVPASDASADPVAAPVTPAVLPPEPAPVSPPPRAPTPDPEEPAPTSPRARAPKPDPEEPAPTPESPTPQLEAAASPARAPAEKKKRKRSFLLVAPLAALVLFVAFVCVPPPPGPGSPVVLSASVSKVSDYFLSVQELHPVELAAWLEQWSSGSLDFVTSYWNALASSSREQEFFGPHTAANLSAAAANDAGHGAGFYYSAAESRPMPIEQEPVGASIFEEELGIQEVVPAIDTAAVAEVAAPGDATVRDESADDVEMAQESFPSTSNVMEELNEFGDDLVAEQVSDDSGEASFSQNIDIPAQSEVLDAEIIEEVSDNSGEEMASFSQDMVDIPSQSEPEPEHIKDDMDVPSLQQDVQTDGAEGDQEEANKEDQEAQHGQKSGSDMWSSYLDKISKPAMAGSVLVVLIVSAALAFLHMRQNRARVSLSTDEPTEQEPAEQVEQLEENRSGSGSSEGQTLAKGSQSQLKDPMVEETDRIGGSGTSQFSSSLSSGLGRRKKNEEQSLQSFEPMSRRESTTSSYGSFTTYEKIPAKKKNKEDEAMTPVRRSSRLRNQVKSPDA